MTPALRAILFTRRWDPSQWYRSSEPGFWYEAVDPANQGATITMYQDSTGVTPVTAVEQPVGLQLDKRYGLVRGSELWGTAAVTVGANWTDNGGGSYTHVAGAATYVQSAIGISAGKVYEARFTVTGMTAGAVGVLVGNTGVGPTLGANGSYAVRMAAAGNTTFYVQPTTAFDGTVSAISVREIPGNHRLQATAASRPTLSARYNLLTKSDTTNVAPWAFTNVSGTATQVGNAYTFGASVSDRIGQVGIAGVLGVSYTGKATLSGSGSVRLILIDGNGSTGIATTTVTLTATPTTYSATGTNTVGGANGGLIIYNNAAGTAGASFTIHNADLRLTTDATGKGPAYQRVDTATSYDTAGFLIDKDFDGVDDSFSGTTGGGGTTGFFYCSAHRIDGGAGTVRTLFSDRGTNTGYRVCINASNKLELSAGNGSAFTAVESAATLSVGSTYVIAAWHDGVNLYVQINQGAIASTAFGTATAGSASFTVGKSNTAASEFLNGLLYGDIYVQNGGVSDANRAKTQRWMANKSGVSL